MSQKESQKQKKAIEKEKIKNAEKETAYLTDEQYMQLYLNGQMDPEAYYRIFSANRKSYWKIKRIFDVVGSAAALLLLSPLFLIISLIIFIDDPHGSPIFSQIRVGRHGNLFKFYKFRSMVVNADDLVEKLEKQNEADGPAFKIKDDPRITRVGAFLRRTGIDELPQLFNVLRGDMTIVGPRPPLPREVEKYDMRQKMRLMVTPGLTCFWQITPNRNDLKFDEWVTLDMEYISNRTFRQDLMLIFKTIATVFRGDGR